jgi:uncharacterized PurR-regulated membrane protein YhhQ (DUF165 family)
MKIFKYVSLFIYLSTIPVANWFINNVGTQSFPEGPHTIPVGFGYQAPSGVLLIGIALFTRDFIQEQFGKQATLVAIAVGILISFFVNPAVAVASAIAFALSELADFGVYTKIKRHTIIGAVVVSGIIGGIIDSFVFLQIAFGSTQFWQGQVIGKTWMALLGGLVIWGTNAVFNRLHTSKNGTATTTAR